MCLHRPLPPAPREARVAELHIQSQCSYRVSSNPTSAINLKVFRRISNRGLGDIAHWKSTYLASPPKRSTATMHPVQERAPTFCCACIKPSTNINTSPRYRCTGCQMY